MDLNSAWKSACTVLLGGEIGELADYKSYLSKFEEPFIRKTSVLSGKPVILAADGFGPKAKFISNDEAAAYRTHHPDVQLNLDEIKDIDSLAAGVAENWAYCGNILLGNYGAISDSHRCTNSFDITGSQDVSDSRFVAYCSMHRFCEYIFGCRYTGDAKFGILCTQFYQSTRCLEALLTMQSADCYYTANLEGCQQCLFCFNLKNKSYCIGNLALQKDKFNSIKKGLLEQMIDELEQKKNLRGIVELLGGSAKEDGSSAPLVQPAIKSSDTSPSASRIHSSSFQSSAPPSSTIENSFGQTTSILLGRKLSSLSSHAPWLLKHARLPLASRSPLSGKPVLVPPHRAYRAWKERAITYEEAGELGKKRISESQAETLTLQNAAQTLKDIAYSTPELRMFENSNMADCVNYYSSSNCHAGAGLYITKNAAFTFFARECECLFGCDMIFYSKFCINCTHSLNLTRCLEVSDSYSCADCYFCHNCENVRDSMFCFNVKNKQYAIGNVEVGREKYMAVKARVLADMANRLEKDKRLDLSVYDLGGGRKN